MEALSSSIKMAACHTQTFTGLRTALLGSHKARAVQPSCSSILAAPPVRVHLCTARIVGEIWYVRAVRVQAFEARLLRTCCLPQSTLKVVRLSPNQLPSSSELKLQDSATTLQGDRVLARYRWVKLSHSDTPVVYLVSLLRLRFVPGSLKTGVALWSSRDSYTASTLFGDLEAPLCHPNWFLNHKHMLRANHEEHVNRMGYFILKVPEYNRQPSMEFTPQGWHFGLHNRENLDTTGSEALKLSIAVAYGLVGEKWDDFCNAIVDDPKSMLICYGLQEGENNWSDDYIKHVLALDALFLAVYLDIQFPTQENQLWTPEVVSNIPDPNNVFVSRYKSWENIVRTDLRRIENQIPFVLIQRVVEYFMHFEDNQNLNGYAKYLEQSLDYAVHLVCFCFMDTSKMDIPYPLEDRTHILGAVYEVICGSKGLLMTSVSRNEYVHISSATTLKHSGIRIIGVDGPLGTLSYKSRSLFLPKMRIYDDTISFIRNMAWYEWNTSNKGCMFHDYVFFIDDLIQAPADLDFLVKKGVIYNGCGIKAFKKWKLSMEGLIEIYSSKEHHDMKVAIKSRCEVKRHRLWSEFRVIFCSKPWLAMSTIAVVLVTLTTLIQAYTAVVGSNRMKPQFP